MSASQQPASPLHILRTRGALVSATAQCSVAVLSSGAFVRLPSAHSATVRAIALPPAHSPLCRAVTGGDDKLLIVWDTSVTPWTNVGSVTVEKKITTVHLLDDGADSWMVLYGDKFGQCALLKPSDFTQSEKSISSELKQGERVNPVTEPAAILGHYATVTALAVLQCSAGQYVVTADRDEKIRVSRFPDSYDIVAYCLRHTDYVTALHQLTANEKPLLLSAGADGRLCVWNALEGQCIGEQKFDFGVLDMAVRVISENEWLVGVVLEKYASLTENIELKRMYSEVVLRTR